MGLDHRHVLQSEQHFRHLQCVSCKLLTSLDSFILQDCNHVICKECVSKSASGLFTCPFCYTKLVGGLQCLRASQPLAHRVLGSIRVACPFQHECGCEWTGDYMKLSWHLKSEHAHITNESPPLISDSEVTDKNMSESLKDDYSETEASGISKEFPTNNRIITTRRSTIDTTCQSLSASTSNNSKIYPRRASTGNRPLESSRRTRSNQHNDKPLPLPANVQRIFARRLSIANNDTKSNSASSKSPQNVARRASMGTCYISSEGLRKTDTKKRIGRVSLRRSSMPTSSMMVKMQQDNDHRRHLLLDGDFFVPGGINLNLISTTQVFDLESATNKMTTQNKKDAGVATMHGSSSGVPLRLLKDQCCSASNAAA